MTNRKQSYSRVAKVRAVDTTIRQTTRSGINLVRVASNIAIDMGGIDNMAKHYNTIRANDGLFPVLHETVGRYTRAGETTAAGLPEHFSRFVVNTALMLYS